MPEFRDKEIEVFSSSLNSNWLRPTSFFLGFLLFAFLERRYPLRSIRSLLLSLQNLLLTVFNSVALLLISPIVMSILSAYSGVKSEGLLGSSELHPYFSFSLSFLILDLAIYWQHRLFHLVPILWKVHSVHHSDSSFDTSTALRFHFIEILISFILKILIITIFGIPTVHFLIFEVILNLSAMFNHSNFQLPLRLEKLLTLFIVSPSFHRGHHSVLGAQMNSNYSFCLSLWDRVFFSYTPYNLSEQKNMKIGLNKLQGKSQLSFTQLLLLPFRK